MVPSKQYKTFETYRKKISSWNVNVYLGKEKKTDALESRISELKKFLSKKTGEVRKKDKYGNYYYEEVSTDKPRIIGAYRKDNAKGIKVKTTVFRYKYSISYVIEIIDNYITNLKQVLKYDFEEIERIKETLNTLELDITKIL